MDVLHENLEKGKNGIGLQNVKKRLALMYPDQHTLTIEKKEGIFTIVKKYLIKNLFGLGNK